MRKLLFLLAVAACGDNSASNQPPEPTESSRTVVATTQEGAGIIIEIDAIDPEGDALTYTATMPEHGTATRITDRERREKGVKFLYMPEAHYGGTDHFNVEVSDGESTTMIPVFLTITRVNDAPTASDIAASTNESQGVAVKLAATDIDSTTLTYKLVTQPEHGTLTGVAPNITYTPTGHYYGTDSFTYQASDGSLDSNIATVTIDIANVLTCGDGIVEGTEQCDDANTSETDACLSNCMAASCGDGFAQAGVEACDDGNADQTDNCLTTCQPAACGDGFVHAGSEACDDGNADQTDGCLSTCVAATCGDGFVQTGVEACDDGNQSTTDTCMPTCVAATCGDGIVQAGVEACDDGNADDTDGCLATCAVATCGDGFVQFGLEQCDDGNADNTDGCLSTCMAPSCGDGFVRAGFEQCDDGNTNNNDACLTSCAAATCGDGFTRSGVEQCDDANSSNTDACLTSCVAASCGDGFTQTGVEQCDDANASNTDACLTTCAAASCGDGFTQAGVEACDDANASNTDACLTTCAAASCGDGFIETGVEACDGGANCDASCALVAPPVCGDNSLDAGEECDDGNSTDNDGCGRSCLIERCGDGLVQFARGEQCDDGNAIDGDGCTACAADPFATTPATLISGALSCSTAPANAARKIAADTSGTIYAVMMCGIESYAVASTDRGITFSAPVSLTADLPNAPVVAAQVAVAAGPSGVAYAAIMLNTGEVYLRTTEDGGATWEAAVSLGAATSTSAGLSLQAFNDDIFVGFATNGGVQVSHNTTRGQGTFATTAVGMSIAFFDLVYDAVTQQLIVAADTPAFHIRSSSDFGATFAGEVNPPGQQYYSDWAFGGGKIFVSGINLGAQGSSNGMYVISTSSLTASTFITGLPTVTTAQSRSLAADAAGNAFVLSQLNGGGVQLDRLVSGASAFDAARALSATGGSPVGAPLPGSQGAVVIFTDGSSVYATVQKY